MSYQTECYQDWPEDVSDAIHITPGDPDGLAEAYGKIIKIQRWLDQQKINCQKMAEHVEATFDKIPGLEGSIIERLKQIDQIERERLERRARMRGWRGRLQAATRSQRDPR